MPFKHHAEHRHHIEKPRYRVTNGPEYDAALRRRGSLTVWFTDEAIAAWRAEPRTTPGGQPAALFGSGDRDRADHARCLPPGVAANRRAHRLRHRASRARSHRAGLFDNEPPQQDARNATAPQVWHRPAASGRCCPRANASAGPVNGWLKSTARRAADRGVSCMSASMPRAAKSSRRRACAGCRRHRAATVTAWAGKNPVATTFGPGSSCRSVDTNA